MKNFIFLLIASLSFVSCSVISGNGDIQDVKRNIPEFHEVKTSGSINIEIKEGDSYSVTVENDENLIPFIVTDVEAGVLNIHYQYGSNISNDHAKVFITAPSLDKIIASGSGNINGNGIMKNVRQVEFSVSGSGNVDMQLDAPTIKVTGSGSGNITLAGRTRDFDCKISGSGDVECANLQSENTSITISGSGNANVFASVHLVARTSGSGDIVYSGNPTSPEIHTSGSGMVKARQ